MQWIGVVRALPVEDRIERKLCPLPPLVAVHRVVAARDGRDALGGKLREVLGCRVRRDVPPVGERVDPRAVRHAFPLRELEQRLDVLDVRVHAAVRNETQQMHVSPALLRAPERGDERLVLVEAAVGDRSVDALEVLVEHAAGSDREVADLRVAHLSRRQPDRFARCGERRLRVLIVQPVEHRRVGELDGVARPRRSDAPAVQDHQRYEREAAAAWHIAANDSTSSDAPPTSAPSTEGCAISSAALSGFTEPP